jgi:glycosyltransferase involved in cell wall biosynthesis
LIPWDWPRLIVPYDYEPRTLAPGSFRLAYVGAVSEAKGVGDLLRALRLLDNVSLTVFGRRQPTLEQLANGLDVRFAGFVATDEIPAAMREVDAVVVPSRHDYAEGLPGTIYQALATRTPLIASDHPMFRGAIAQDESALIFPAGDEKALASAVKRLAQDPELYGKLSANSLRAWEALQLPVKWGTLMEKWLSDQPADRQWLHDHRLVSGLYHDQIKVRRGVGHLSERASTRSRAAAFARLFAGRRGRFGQAAPHSPDLLARPVQQI